MLTGRKHTEETKKKISEALKGHKAWNKGLPAWNRGIKGDAYKKHFKNGMGGQFEKGLIPWNKGIEIGKNPKHSKRMKKLSKERNLEKNFGIYAKKGSPGTRHGKLTPEQRSGYEKYWKSLKGRKLSRETIRKCLRRRDKSSLEIKMEDIIKRHQLPYRFVGNGDFFIERKNPDFINCNGEKIAIEVFYRRHKEYFSGGLKTWMKDREEIFSKYGWKLLFFDETQVNDDNILQQLKNGGDYY